ncbi:Aquaporin AQPAn.G [Folsomia candida]|uniref:Aquaporin AQPAn.G n=2 Tax=Folsomia candida TaxID=158441 RepID=A0A226DS97_FOLCA|nr:Aquaporin AQPAn.G [Folsomia candida]
MRCQVLHIRVSWRELCQGVVRELIGSCLLIVVGCGSVLSANFSNPKVFNVTGVALCWGMMIASLAFTLECHMNPAVSFALASTGQIPLLTCALYIVAQCMGTTLGAQILVGFTPKKFTWSLGVTQLAKGVSPMQALGMEFISTFLLLLVVSAANDTSRGTSEQPGGTYMSTSLKSVSSNLVVGLCVSALILFFGPFTGASMNPARTFGPSFITGNWKNHWIYWLGPILGAFTGVVCYHFLFQTPQKSNTREPPVIKNESNGHIPRVEEKGIHCVTLGA